MHTIFPAGEVHVNVEKTRVTTQRADLWSSNDIMEMLLRNDAQKRLGCRLKWLIPYVPYARQDRVCNAGEALSIKVMADLIDTMDAAEVTIWDPHSDVAPALIHNVRLIEQHTLVKRIIRSQQYSGVVAPDVGAAKKAAKVAEMLGIPLYQAHKVRNTQTGVITKTVLLDTIPLDTTRLLVVDDICDGGRTFIELGKLLKDYRVDLYVTHGIFSKGVDELLAYYDSILCANPKNKTYGIQHRAFHDLEPF